MGYGKGQDLLQELAVLAGTGAKLLLVHHLERAPRRPLLQLDLQRHLQLERADHGLAHHGAQLGRMRLGDFEEQLVL